VGGKGGKNKTQKRTTDEGGTIQGEKRKKTGGLEKRGGKWGCFGKFLTNWCKVKKTIKKTVVEKKTSVSFWAYHFWVKNLLFDFFVLKKIFFFLTFC